MSKTALGDGREGRDGEQGRVERPQSTHPFLKLAPTSGRPTNTTSPRACCAKSVTPTVPTPLSTLMYSCDLVYFVIKRTPKNAREPARIGGKNARCIATGNTRCAFALVFLRAKKKKKILASARVSPRQRKCLRPVQVAHHVAGALDPLHPALPPPLHLALPQSLARAASTACCCPRTMRGTTSR